MTIPKILSTLLDRIFRPLVPWSRKPWLVAVIFALNVASLAWMFSVQSPAIYREHQAAMDAIEPPLGSLAAPWGRGEIAGIMLPDAWWGRYPPETLFAFHDALAPDPGSYWLLRLCDTVITPPLNFVAMALVALWLLRAVWRWEVPNRSSRARAAGGYVVLGFLVVGTVGETECLFDMWAYFSQSPVAAALLFAANRLKWLGYVIAFPVFVAVSLLAWPVLRLIRRSARA